MPHLVRQLKKIQVALSGAFTFRLWVSPVSKVQIYIRKGDYVFFCRVSHRNNILNAPLLDRCKSSDFRIRITDIYTEYV